MFGLIFSFIILTLLVGLLIWVILLSQTRFKKFEWDDIPDIPKFYKDIEFTPFPDTINIENQYDCNVENLRVCKLDDSSTLFGCKELSVRCHHFDKDTVHIENNKTTTIPRNKDPNEGYALALHTIAEACNFYHGDMILITTDVDSTEYMMVCACKNPGYIGNESLMGNCSKAFICNGEVDDIDKPLDKIKCKCNNDETMLRYDDGLPVCQQLTVLAANEKYQDWTHLVDWGDKRLLDIKLFNPTISGNLHATHLINPCRHSIHDTSVKIDDGEYSMITNQCIITTSGFPVATNILQDRHPMLSSDRNHKRKYASAVLATGKLLRLRFVDRINDKRRLTAESVKGVLFDENLPTDRELLLVPEDGFTVGRHQTFSLKTGNLFFGPKCKPDWPTYYCNFSAEYREGQMKDEMVLFKGNKIAGAFLWKTEEWNDNEFFIENSCKYDRTMGFSMNSITFTKQGHWLPYGIQWTPITLSRFQNSLLSFTDPHDFDIHQRNTIDQADDDKKDKKDKK